MSGVILATAIGGAAVSTGAVVAAGIGAGTTLYGGAKSFSDANKARKRGEAAERAADKAIEEAKRRVDVNAYEQLSIAKEPYELMRDALLTQGATGMQAGVEGETRGAAATAGRMQMAQNLRQGEVRGEMGQRMDEINKLVAGEDKRRQLQLAGIAMEETAGAQLAVRDAEEDRANYIAQGVGTLGSIAEGLSSSYAAGDFGRIKARGLAAESENVGELLAGLDAFGMPTEREQRQAQRQAQANNMVDFPQPMSRREERQLNRAANDIQRAQAQNQRALNRLEGQPFLPPGAATPPPMQPRMVQSSVNSPVLQPLAGPQARIVPQAGTTRTSGPLDPFDPFGGGGFTPPSPVNATRAEARASVAPAGVGGPLQSMPPRQVDSQTPTAELQGSRSQRPVAPTFGGGSYYNGKGNNEQASVEDLVKILKKEEGLTDAEVEIAKKRFKVEPDGSVGFSMPPSELEDEYFNRESAGSRAGVQSVGETETARELLERLRAEGQEEIATPNPTAQEIEKVNTEAVEKAEEVGPAAAEVVRSATEGVTSSNPLPIAMQWLNVREPNYREYDPATGDSVYVETPKITPEGQKLLTEVWAGVGQTEAGQKKFIKEEQAWCAGFVNKVLADSNLTGLEGGRYQKARADMYMSAKFGENIYTNESIKRSNLHGDLKGKPEKYGFPKVKGSVKDAKMGDVVIINRPKSGADTRHVGFFAGYDKDGNMKVLGGNQGDEVNITVYNASDVIGIRRVNQPDLTDKELEAVSKIVTRKEGATR